MGAEITSIKKKVEEFTAESAASQPIPAKDSTNKSDIFPSKGKGGSERKSEIPGSPAPQDTEWRKKCPMCGGRLDFHSHEEMWQCYSCAYEEPKDEVLVDGEEKNEPANAPQPAPASKPGSGAYEELNKDEVQSESEETSEPANTPKPAPASKPGSGSSPLRAVHLGSLKTRNQKRDHHCPLTSHRPRKRPVRPAVKKWIGSRWRRPGGAPSATTREVSK